MRRSLLVAGVVVLVAGVAVSLAAGSGAASGRWVIRDLGTLSGSGIVVDLNERGEIIARVTYPEERALVWKNGEWTDLGALPGMGSHSGAFTLNDRGQIIGQSCTRRVLSCLDPRTAAVSRAFVWANGKMTGLRTLGGRSTRGWDINNKGEIVGSSDTGGQHVRAVLWRNGKVISLGTLGGKHSGALAINERSQIVGWSDTSDPKAGPRFFLWENGKMNDLGIEVDRRTEWAWGSRRYLVFINERGHVAGQMKGTAYDDHWQGFFWRDGRLRTLSLLPHGINDRDEIPAEGDLDEAVVWRNGTPRRLGLDTTFGWQQRTVINDRGQIIANDAEGNLRSFVWENGKRAYLPTREMGDPVGAVVINNSGQIAGWSGSHAVLWTWQPAR